MEMIIGYSSWCSGSLPPQIFLCDPVGVPVPLIEASQSAHIEILSLFLFSFSCSHFFFLPFLVSWGLLLPSSPCLTLFLAYYSFFSFPFPSSLPFLLSPPNPSPLHQPTSFPHSGPSGFKRVIAVLKSVCIEFARLQTIQTISFVTFSPRCQLAWLSWQQQSFYLLPPHRDNILLRGNFSEHKREKKTKNSPQQLFASFPPPLILVRLTHKRLVLKVIGGIK